MTTMTFGELKLHSNRVREDPPVKDFELAVRELIDEYKGKISKSEALDALMRQRDLVDEEWSHMAEVAAEGASGPDEGSSAEGEDAPETPSAA